MNGLTIRTATEDDYEAMARHDARAFGHAYDADEYRSKRSLIDLGRFVVTYDGHELVGVNGSFALEMTLPGGTTIPVGGVTWVSVAATHRRRGILRATIEAVHRDIADRGEPVCALGQSEGGIYGRFGYGQASVHWTWTLETTLAALRPDVVVEAASVRFLTGDAVHDHVERCFETYRRTSPGEMHREPAWWNSLWDVWERPVDGLTESHFLCHADGYARYRVSSDWNNGLPRHKAELLELVALTPAARAGLWHALLGLDLVTSISGSQVAAIDDPFPDLLSNPRLVRTTSMADGLWLRVTDPATAFSARSYGVEGSVVVEADGARWQIEGGPAGGECRRTRARADITTDTAGLGSLLLGGGRIHRMIALGRLDARSTEVGRRADHFFLGDTMPNYQTQF